MKNETFKLVVTRSEIDNNDDIGKILKVIGHRLVEDYNANSGELHVYHSRRGPGFTTHWADKDMDSGVVATWQPPARVKRRPKVATVFGRPVKPAKRR